MRCQFLISMLFARALAAATVAAAPGTLGGPTGACSPDSSLAAALSQEALEECLGAHDAVELLQLRQDSGPQPVLLSPGARAAAVQAGHERQIPHFSDILDVARHAAANSIAGSVTNAAAVIVATTLNGTLFALGAQADRLTAVCTELDETLHREMKRAGNNHSAKVTVVAAQGSEAVQAILPLWSRISTAVRVAGDVAVNSLGQDKDGTLQEKMNDAMARAGKMVARLANASELSKALAQVAQDKLSEKAMQLNATLEQALLEVEAFAEHLGSAFEHLGDKAAGGLVKGIPATNSTVVTRAFGGVSDTAKILAKKTIRGPEILIQGLLEVTTELVRSGESEESHRSWTRRVSSHFGGSGHSGARQKEALRLVLVALLGVAWAA